MSLELELASKKHEILPRLEALYKSRPTGNYYTLQQSDEKGSFMVAARDIQRGEVVWIEKPLCHLSMAYDLRFLQRPDVAPLISTLSEFAKSHGHLSGADRYPPEARHALDRISEMQATENLANFPRIPEVWKLHDAHHCAEKGDRVMIDGLRSEAGKKLNGKHGCVAGVDQEAPDRLAVMLSTSRTDQSMKKSIKPINLKTLGGIVRTNAFENDEDNNNNDGGLPEILLFQTLSRVNHACGNAANVRKTMYNGQAYVLATKSIAEGEEILIDYIPDQDNPKNRPGLLHLKYNFWCHCGEH